MGGQWVGSGHAASGPKVLGPDGFESRDDQIRRKSGLSLLLPAGPAGSSSTELMKSVWWNARAGWQLWPDLLRSVNDAMPGRAAPLGSSWEVPGSSWEFLVGFGLLVDGGWPKSGGETEAQIND